ncbi:MAG TPA: DUF4129 domain-containing protein [Pedococcus sp.]|nr:DUF4129 domain-containing protein [Pedococcus sp.]
MTRGRWLLLGAAGTTLLLSAWVAAAGPVALFARQNADPVAARRPPGSDFDQFSNVPPPPKKIYSSSDANETVVAVIVWGLKLAIVAIIAAVVFLIARELWSRRRAADVEQPEATGIDTLPEVLLEGAGARMAELRSGTPTNAIVACWMRLEAEVAAAGVRLSDSQTSTEVTATVLRDYTVDPSALNELAALFREARFSAHELTEAHRARAADALTAVHVDLRRAATREALRA